MAAQFVRPFRKNPLAKNDPNDAEAIATAARQGNMRFVPVKDPGQQARLAWHRVRLIQGSGSAAATQQDRLRKCSLATLHRSHRHVAPLQKPSTSKA